MKEPWREQWLAPSRRETPPSANPAARCEASTTGSGLDGVAALAVLALGGRHRQAHLLAQRSRTGIPAPNAAASRSLSSAPWLLRRPAASAVPGSWSVLLPSRPSGFAAGLGFFAPLGAFLAGVAFLADFAFFGATWAPCFAARGLFVGFRLRFRRRGWGAAGFFCNRCIHVFSFGGDHRGQDIDHSGRPRKQVNSAGRSRWFGND